MSVYLVFMVKWSKRCSVLCGDLMFGQLTNLGQSDWLEVNQVNFTCTYMYACQGLIKLKVL